MKIIPCQRTYQSLFLALFGGKHSCLLVHQAGRDLLLMWVGLVPRGWRQTHQLETNWKTASFFGQGGLLLSSNTYKQSLCDRQQWHEGRQNTAAHLLSLTCNTRGEATRRRNPGAIMRWTLRPVATFLFYNNRLCVLRTYTTDCVARELKWLYVLMVEPIAPYLCMPRWTTLWSSHQLR